MNEKELESQMKLFVTFMIAVLFIAMLLPFTILKGRDGNTMMSLSDIELPDFSLPSMPSMPKLPKLTGSSEPVPADDSDMTGKDVFYKWYDNEGNVQFTTEPPADGIEYTLKGFDPNTNVIQAVNNVADGLRVVHQQCPMPLLGITD